MFQEESTYICRQRFPELTGLVIVSLYEQYRCQAAPNELTPTLARAIGQLLERGNMRSRRTSAHCDIFQ